MDAMRRFLKERMETGDIPFFITLKEAKGKRFAGNTVFERYEALLFEPNHIVLFKKNRQYEWEFVEDIFKELNSSEWFDFIQTFTQDKEKNRSIQKQMYKIDKREREEKEYARYLELKEKYEKKKK